MEMMARSQNAPAPQKRQTMHLFQFVNIPRITNRDFDFPTQGLGNTDPAICSLCDPNNISFARRGEHKAVAIKANESGFSGLRVQATLAMKCIEIMDETAFNQPERLCILID